MKTARPAFCWNRSLTTSLLTSGLLGVTVLAHAQDTTVKHLPPAHIQWHLTVISDGKTVDDMSADTAIGQSATFTHRRDASHPVGCEGAQTAPVELTRTVSVSPLGVDQHGVIGFAVSADEMVEDPTARTVPSDGCQLPPQTRSLSARHPEWDVPSGKSADWVLLKKDPTLTYHLDATVKPAAADD